MDALSQVFEDIHLKQTQYLYLEAQGQWAFESEHQSAMITHIVLFGTAYVHFEGQTSVLLNTGDMMIIPSGIKHHCSSHMVHQLVEPLKIEALFQGLREDPIQVGQHDTNQVENKSLIFTIKTQIDSIMAGPLIQALPTYLHIKSALNAQEPEWLRIGLYFVANETTHKQPGRHKIMDHVVSIMLIECVREYINEINDENNWLNALTHPELANAFSAIHSQPEQAWTVEKLAERCFMSRSKFANLFHEIVGEPPLAYLKQHRLRLASQYLRTGQLSIQQIAHHVGYSSETAFSQTFKKYFQLSPSQYRQLHYAQQSN